MTTALPFLPPEAAVSAAEQHASQAPLADAENCHHETMTVVIMLIFAPTLCKEGMSPDALWR